MLFSLPGTLLPQPLPLAFNGRIEVDITAEDLPANDARKKATFGKQCLTLLVLKETTHNADN